MGLPSLPSPSLYPLAGRFIIFIFRVASSSRYWQYHVPRKVGECQTIYFCPSAPFLAALPACPHWNIPKKRWLAKPLWGIILCCWGKDTDKM